jgi:hypothetical protein
MNGHFNNLTKKGEFLYEGVVEIEEDCKEIQIIYKIRDIDNEMHGACLFESY